MPIYYGFDYTYIILVVPCILFALWAQVKVKSTFNRYSHIYSKKNLTGAQAAKLVLQSAGIYNVRIEHISGHLSDHYDPHTNVIRLSDSVYGSTSVASIGVAAHEAGHAVQYASHYIPIKLRSAIVPITNIGSALSWPLLLLGLFLNFSVLIYVGILFFGLSTIFQLITLPVELNASRRALNAIENSGLLAAEEIPMAKKTLWAAAMTYVAALAVSLAQLLRLILLFGSRGRRND